MKNLSQVFQVEQEEFFNSFDQILCDVDGVLWRNHETIPGAQPALAFLQNLKKKIHFVSNNSTKTQKKYFEELQAAGYNLIKSDVLQPLEAIVDYLKKINFDKEIFLIGLPPLQSALEEVGFKIVEYAEEKRIESISEYLKYCTFSDNSNNRIGAVVVDMEYNLTDLKLQRAATYLDNKDVLFITGGSDRRLVGEGGRRIIGPGAYQDILENISGRKPLNLSKPSSEFGQFVKEKCDIKNPGRVLFIGDSIAEDMVFATNSGFQKLLVLSGVTKKEDLENWQYLDDTKPQYFVESLKDVYEALKHIYPNLS